jgi:hypothetical protein
LTLCSSSLTLCSSSFEATISSLVAWSSSLLASSSSTVAWRFSRVRESSSSSESTRSEPIGISDTGAGPGFDRSFSATVTRKADSVFFAFSRSAVRGEVLRAPRGRPLDGRVSDRARFPRRACQRPGHREAHLIRHEVEEIGREAPRGNAQQRLRAVEAFLQHARLAHQEALRHEALEQRVVGRQQVRLGARARHVAHAAHRHPRGHLGPVHAAAVHALAIELGLLAHRVEARLQLAGTLARAQEQEPADAQPIREAGERAPLRLRAQVDQHVAAGDEVEVRERRVGEQVVLGEHDAVADLGVHLVAAVRAHLEVRRQALVAHPLEAVLRVDPRPGGLERALVDVGREDLERAARAGLADGVVEHDGDRERLFARGAGRHPRAQLALGLDRVPDQLVDLPREGVEARLVAEEVRDPDQQVVMQGRELFTVLLQQSQVIPEVLRGRQARAPQHAPVDGAALVVVEVDALAQPQQRDHFLHHTRGFPVRQLAAGHVLDQRAREARAAHHHVDDAGLDGRLRHAVEARGLRVLHQHEAALRLHPPGAARAVGAASGQDHGDRALATVRGERRQEAVDGEGQVPILLPVGDLEAPVGDLELLAGRQEVDVVGLDALVVLGLAHRDLGEAGEELFHEALVVRREVLDHDEREPGIVGHRAKELLEGLEAPGRCAHASDETRLLLVLHPFPRRLFFPCCRGYAKRHDASVRCS